MATLEKAEGLLEELRGASYDAAVKDMGELEAFAAEHVSLPEPAVPAASHDLGHGRAQGLCCRAGELPGPAVPAAPYDVAVPSQFMNPLS